MTFTKLTLKYSLLWKDIKRRFPIPKATHVSHQLRKFGIEFTCSSKENMAVIKPFLTKLTLYQLVKNCYTECYENMTNGVAFATRSETDGETDGRTDGLNE
jgi:hypothetical protein